MFLDESLIPKPKYLGLAGGSDPQRSEEMLFCIITMVDRIFVVLVEVNGLYVYGSLQSRHGNLVMVLPISETGCVYSSVRDRYREMKLKEIFGYQSVSLTNIVEIPDVTVVKLIMVS